MCGGAAAGNGAHSAREETVIDLDDGLPLGATDGVSRRAPEALAAPTDLRRGFDGLSALVGEHLGREATSGDLSDPGYLSVRRDATRLARAAISAPLAGHGLEAIVALTANPACLTDYVLGDHDVFHTSGPAATPRPDSAVW